MCRNLENELGWFKPLEPLALTPVNPNKQISLFKWEERSCFPCLLRFPSLTLTYLVASLLCLFYSSRSEAGILTLLIAPLQNHVCCWIGAEEALVMGLTLGSSVALASTLGPFSPSQIDQSLSHFEALVLSFCFLRELLSLPSTSKKEITFQPFYGYLNFRCCSLTIYKLQCSSPIWPTFLGRVRHF